MIHNIKPYPKMKDSGVPWLGEVPEHWGINRTKTLFRLRTEKSGIAHDHQLLSIYTHIGVRPRKELQEKGNKASTTDNYWIVKKGDIIANKLLTWMGAIGMSKYNGVTSPAYDILMPIQEIVTEFYHHLFRTSIYRQQFKQYSRGIMDMRLRLYFDQFGQILIPIPPSEDQEQIVRFLNHFDRKIGRYILTKQKLIKLLEEQKQAIIHQVVTRSLDPNVRLKSSGVNWLGDFPEHWEIRRLKFLAKNVTVQTSSKLPEEAYVALEHVESCSGRITLPDGEVTFDSQVKRFKSNDVLFGKLRPYLAKVTRPQVSGVCVGEFLVLRAVEPHVLPEFLEQKLRSKQFIDIINRSTFGAKMPRASWTFIGSLLVTYPPTHEEQKAILSQIGERTMTLQTAIDRAKGEIALLREYRTRLIADVVTGKLDVREAAAQLPDETEEPEPLDDLEALAEGDELEEGADLESLPEEAEV